MDAYEETSMKRLVVILFVCLACALCYADEGKVLFDNAHAQTAGNADWIISGGYSDFADTLTQQGYTVVESKVALRSDVLSQYNVLVIPEPNRRFDTSEIDAIVNFIKNGGGVLFVADHYGSDRDNDGYDSVKIFNEFVGQFGFVFDERKISEAPINGTRTEHEAIANAFKFGCWGATSMTIQNPGNVKSLLRVSQQYGGNPFIIAATFGQGRIVAIGDSSPLDDGTGTPGNSLHDNYNMAPYDHHQMAISFVRWLSFNNLRFNDTLYLDQDPRDE